MWVTKKLKQWRECADRICSDSGRSALLTSMWLKRVFDGYAQFQDLKFALKSLLDLRKLGCLNILCTNFPCFCKYCDARIAFKNRVSDGERYWSVWMIWSRSNDIISILLARLLKFIECEKTWMDYQRVPKCTYFHDLSLFGDSKS